jgi:predicted nuclease with TOPRIM domain
MFEFAEVTKDMTASEILNYYRNLYYAEPQVTERGIVANAINDFFADVVPKSEVEELSGKYEDLKLKYADLQKDKDELIAWGDDKKTEVAREIFEEIEKILPTNMTVNGTFYRLYLKDALAELKKKYTEGEA